MGFSEILKKYMVFFNSRDQFYKEPFGAVAEQTEVRFRFCVPRYMTIKKAMLIADRDGCDEVSVHAYWASLVDGMDVYECYYKPPTTGIYFYRFCIITEQDEWIFIVPHKDCGRFSDSKDDQYQLTVYSKDFDTPHWMRGGLMYQIFPDRYNRSRGYDMAETLKDPRARIGMQKEYVLREDWGGLPVYKPNEEGIITNNDFFGGNLRGILEKLPYLEELGVTVLYLNPIFEAFSTHRYDASDFMRIDPMLGTESDFEELCCAAKKYGIRIILDGAFSHTGSDSVYFNKKGRYPGVGAYQGTESPYYTWYRFSSFPDVYSCWWGINTLPQVQEENPDYMKYVINGENSVVKHWIRRGASGFRLDVADELPAVFLDELREAVKETDAEAAIIGEVWEDASNKIAYDRRTQYFHGKQLDSVMNYPLKDAIIQFLQNKIDGNELCSRLEILRENYPKQVFYGTMNLLGTHDTARILTVLTLEDRIWEFSKEEKANLKITEDELSEGKGKLYLALLIWAFFPGIPCLYYGDELGMQGCEDPFNRCCYEPDRADEEIYDFYRSLLRFRKEAGLFGEWEYKPFEPKQDIFGFWRVNNEPNAGTAGLFVIVNKGNCTERVNIPLSENQRIEKVFNCGIPAAINGSEADLSAMSGLIIKILNEAKK